MESVAVSAENPAKRQRLSAACDACRARKVKCDGQKPVCAACSKDQTVRPDACHWGSRKKRGPAASSKKTTASSRNAKHSRSRQLTKKPSAQQTEASSAQPTERPSAQVNEDLDAGQSTHESAPNAMMGLMDESLQTSPNSSMSSFVREIRAAISDSRDTLRKDQGHSGQEQCQKQAARSLLDTDYVLPPRHTADQLMATYLRLMAGPFPFLDRISLNRMYNSLWLGESLEEDGPIFLCCLNAIFAVACLVNPDITPSDRVRRAKVFYSRSRGFLDIGIIQYRSLLAIQCFLVLSQYLQSTNQPQECWYFVGLATRTAQSMGLDLPSTSAKVERDRHRDLLKRVWYGCLFMDRALTLIFGRPGMITYRPVVTVPFPDLHSDCSGLDTTIPCIDSPVPCCHGLHYFIESMKLYEIVAGTCLTVYCRWNQDEGQDHAADDPYVQFFGSSGLKAVQTILDVDRNLWLWKSSLPSHLRRSGQPRESVLVQRQTNMLWLAYCHVRIILFRPVLSTLCSCDKSQSNTMWHKLATYCSTACAEASCDIVDCFSSTMMTRTIDELDDLLPPWWYSTYYLYTAAMVLLATGFHLGSIAELSEEKIMNALKTAITLLRRFEVFGSHVKQSLASLLTVFNRVTRGHDIEHQNQLHQSELEPTTSNDLGHRGGENANDITNQGLIGAERRISDRAMSSQPSQTLPTVAMNMSDNNVQWTSNANWMDNSMIDHLSSEPNFFTIPDFEMDPNDMSWLDAPFAFSEWS